MYDEDGNYKGKILSDEEHSKRENAFSGPDIYSKEYRKNFKWKEWYSENRFGAIVGILGLILLLCASLGLFDNI